MHLRDFAPETLDWEENGPSVFESYDHPDKKVAVGQAAVFDRVDH